MTKKREGLKELLPQSKSNAVDTQNAHFGYGDTEREQKAERGIQY